jgi:rhodanese-related sulfurtransferase/DNA-binding transcriptional ArsR family regulator
MTVIASSQRKRRFKNDVYAAVVRIPAALANSHRLELLDLLSQCSRTVQDIASEAGLSVANASQHLGVLQRSGLVSVDRRGTFAFYRVADPAVYRLLAGLRAVAESVDTAVVDAERSYFGIREPGLDTYDAAQEVVAMRNTVLLDVRPREEYDAAHLPGAVSVPLAVLHADKHVLSTARRYVVYCRGAYCVFADEAVALLRARGFKATRLSLGPAEWLAAGGEVRRVG